MQNSSQVAQQDSRKFANARFPLAFLGEWGYISCSPMAERENLSKLSTLALRNRREGLTKLLPPLRRSFAVP